LLAWPRYAVAQHLLTAGEPRVSIREARVSIRASSVAAMNIDLYPDNQQDYLRASSARGVRSAARPGGPGSRSRSHSRRGAWLPRVAMTVAAVAAMSVLPPAAVAQPLPTLIVLPDGSQCTLSATVQPAASYLCNTTTNGNPNVLIGTPSIQGDAWVITTGVLGQNNSIISTTQIQTDITHVDLVDGTGCDFAGKGATVDVNGQRINYTCSTQNTTYLIGNFNTAPPLWTAARVVVTGGPGNFTVVSSDNPGISRAVNQTATPPPGELVPIPVAPPVTHDNRYFSVTGFRIDNDAFYNFFLSLGGVDTFGFPVSRQFGFLGCQSQILQRAILQQCGQTAPVALMNLLDPEIFPYSRINGSVFPEPNSAIKDRTPQVGSPGYDQAIIQFVQQVAPNTFNGQPVNFYQTFNQNGGLVMWGAPISNPAADPSNSQFIYQRFQRGIMHFTVGQGTRGILLADYLKSVMLGPTWAPQKGSSLPPDLNQQAQGSPQYAQYCPGETRWMCRPNALPGTDLTYAFEVG
jgi:hypothetical protein